MYELAKKGYVFATPEVRTAGINIASYMCTIKETTVNVFYSPSPNPQLECYNSPPRRNYVERSTVRVQCLGQEHNTMSPAGQGLSPGPLDPQSSAVTIHPLRVNHVSTTGRIFVDDTIYIFPHSLATLRREVTTLDTN